jgi:hypothetical protein
LNHLLRSSSLNRSVHPSEAEPAAHAIALAAAQAALALISARADHQRSINELHDLRHELPPPMK